MIGETVGSWYRITARIGEGGMGEVYRATDTRLGRDVAIKFSAEQFTERFEREARTVASLNNPHICTLYDVGPNYLVMELIEGPTLAERIAEGAIPLDEALDIVRQIATALAAAHEAGIVHRDLKPGNIKITRDGRVKVLDFGLAKVGGTPAVRPEDSHTFDTAATQAGVILGTAGYMSPEQARGKPVDKRADIWALGVVLFEMLTGRRLFKGDSVGETLAAAIRDEPDWDQAPAKTRRLLRRCLEKDPKRRLQDIGDLEILLEDPPPAASRRSILPWAVAALLGLGFVGASLAWWRAAHQTEERVLRPLARLDVDLGPEVSLDSPFGTDVIISPDGNRLVFVSHSRLFTRRLDQPSPVELAGTENAVAPFFSPNGEWIAFFAQDKLKKIPVEGGTVITLCPASPTPRGGSWGTDGFIVAALVGTSGLRRIPEGGGDPVPITELDLASEKKEVTHRWPQILPGDKAVLFTVRGSQPDFDEAGIEVLTLAGNVRKNLDLKGSYARYLPTGHIIYISRGTLFAVPFDLDSLSVIGAPSPVLEGVGANPTFGSAQFDVSQTGTLIYRTVGGAGVTVQWLDSAGNTRPLLSKPGYYSRILLSPNGERLALNGTEQSGEDIWIYDWRRDSKTLLSPTGRSAQYPLWSPDGAYIAFWMAGGTFWTRADASSQPQPLTSSQNLQYPWSFTADGSRLAFMEVSAESGYDIWTVPIEKNDAGLRAAGKPEPYLQRSFDDRHPAFSPDGRWLAYASNESGPFQIWVRPYPDKTGQGWLITGGGLYPIWSRNGRELFFRTEDNQIMVVTYTVKGDVFIPDKPRLWTEKRIANVGIFRNYDLAPDGKQVAALMPIEAPGKLPAQNRIIFLENFFDEVIRRVPTVTGNSP